MAIGNVFRKLSEFGKRIPKPGKGISSNEVELASFMEEKRQDEIKQLVDKFRRQKNQEILFNNTLANQGRSSIIDAKPIQQENVFNSRNTLLDTQIPKKRNLFFT